MAVQQGACLFRDEIAGRHLNVWTDYMPLVLAMKSELPQQLDPVSENMLQEKGRTTCNICFVDEKGNAVAEALSGPSNVALGAEHRIPEDINLARSQ